MIAARTHASLLLSEPAPRHRRAPLAPALLTLVVTAALGCNEKDPTSTGSLSGAEAVQASVAAADGGDSAASQDVIAQGTIPLPVDQTGSSADVLFGITQTGAGPSGRFTVTNTGGFNNALEARTAGGGAAGFFEITNANSFGNALEARTTGRGSAGSFRITNSSNAGSTVDATTNGRGAAVSGFNLGTGRAGEFRINNNTSNSSPALDVSTSGTGSAILAQITNSNSAGIALFAQTLGSGDVVRATARTGRAGNFQAANLSEALFASNSGSGFAAKFVGLGPTSKGVLIQTAPGAVGLQVFNGTKNAVVQTPEGAKALYTEESTEVWFTDYGFGQLQNGRARILLDPTFAQTINPEEPYHVFLQARGNAELYVGESTPLGFEVALREGDPDAEFSYRVVAKRLGFEGERLEPAPWADQVARGFEQSR
jgi:hypothetical protein